MNNFIRLFKLFFILTCILVCACAVKDPTSITPSQANRSRESLQESSKQSKTTHKSEASRGKKLLTKPRTIMKKGSIGLEVKIKIPTGNEILKKQGGKYPNGYWNIEQRISRYATGFLKSGEANNEDEALKLANDHYKERKRRENEMQKTKPRRAYKPRPPGYNAKEAWIRRRIVGLLEAHNSGISNHADAFERAEALYKEKMARGSASRKKKT